MQGGHSPNTRNVDNETYADRTILVDILGQPSKVRILEVLLSEDGDDLNPSEICRLGGIGTSSFYDHIDTLRAWGLVERSRMVGNSPMFRLNTDSEAAQSLNEFVWHLLDYLSEKEQAGELDESNRPTFTED